MQDVMALLKFKQCQNGSIKLRCKFIVSGESNIKILFQLIKRFS